jgi:serine/threonine protein phosphatase PrpC
MMLPGLAMSRSIGDDIAASVGVHATPEVTAVPLLPKHKFMIVASDGVWEFLTSEDAVAIVVQCNGNAEKAAAELCARSFREWRAEEEVVDDITAVVVYF